MSMPKIRAAIVLPTVCHFRRRRETEKTECDNLKIVEHSLATTGSSLAMSRHVILLTDAHEAPAYELIEALRAAGVRTLIEGLREVEIAATLARQHESESPAEPLGPPPLAVLYEVVPGADMFELPTAVEHA